MSIQTRSEVERVLGQVTFAPSCVDMGWGWEISQYSHQTSGWNIRTTFQRPDTNTGEIGTGEGRWWFIGKGITPSGLVKTAWLACKQIVEHELMEAFMYQSVRVFDPHADVADLIDLNRRRRI